MTDSPRRNPLPIVFLFAVLALLGYVFLGQQPKTGEPSNTTGASEAEAKSATTSPAAASVVTPSETASLLTPKPIDIILGDPNALITMVEYSSLSCPHCAHFHDKVLPALQKQWIDSGKLKLVIRHFPINEPAIRAAQLVECAGQNGLERANFVKVLFSMQSQWAFSEDFLKSLKQIGQVGGIDSAAFESCITDKELETRILTSRQVADQQLKVSSTPTFFINGVKFEDAPEADAMSKALEAAANHSAKPKK